MSERIVIDFGDEEKNPKAKTASEENRIVIDLDNEEEVEKKKIDVEEIEAGYEEKIRNSKVNSFYKGDSHLSSYHNSDLNFPEGIDQGFRKNFSINLKDEFFNSILENNRHIILSSIKGNVYLIDRFTGKADDKIFFEDESFEKTGLVYENVIYLNSLRKIYRLKQNDENGIMYEEIYSSPEGYYIWSSLNRYKGYIIFTEYCSSQGKATLKIVNAGNINPVFDHGFKITDFISDKICIADGCAYMLFDSSVMTYDLEKMTAKEFTLDIKNIKTDENSFIFYLNYRIYITTRMNELYYLDMPPVNHKFKFTGIKNTYLNSIGGFADNIFTGTLDGWKFFKSSGLQVYSFEDEFENKIECISKNVLVISKNNKIVFCNLNRFQEAEGYVIASGETNESVEIISAVISHNGIFVLSKNGNLVAFTNDKLNIHL